MEMDRDLFRVPRTKAPVICSQIQQFIYKLGCGSGMTSYEIQLSCKPYRYVLFQQPTSTMRTIAIFTLFIFYCGLVFGQENTVQKSNQVKFSPLRMIDLVNPGFEIGFEKNYGKNLSSQISVGLMSDPFELTQFTNYNGFRFSFEEKCFKNLSGNKRDYYSIEPVFLRVSYSDEGQFIKDTALNTPEYWDTFKVAKQTFALNFKYGIQFNFNHFNY